MDVEKHFVQEAYNEQHEDNKGLEAIGYMRGPER